MAKGLMNKHLRYFLLCLPFAGLLFLHELGLGGQWLENPWVELGLCLPVFGTGMYFFGGSAVRGLRKGRWNMNVLIAVGAVAAFLYSLTGTLLQLGPAYLFYETAAAIITLVFLGYYLEDVSVQGTRRALDALVVKEKVMANMVAYDDQQQEMVFPVESSQLRSGDLVLIRSGERVPADVRILWGEAGVDESILTGESLPVEKKSKDLLVGGSLLVSGVVRGQVTAAPEDSILAGIVKMVQQAQREKPPVQQLADKVSAVFVPAVLVLAVLAFIVNFIVLRDLTPSLMRGIAVLVIACPCAMGLATPTAIAVGLGRAARRGILFRRAAGLEAFRDIRQVVFDKTGTLTTGVFRISRVGGLTVEEDEFRRIVFSLEKYSTHPIARSITMEWRLKNDVRWSNIREIRGQGMRGEGKDGDVYLAGSYKIAAHLTEEKDHNVYVLRNDRLLGWIDVEDTIRPEASEVIRWLRTKGCRVILLSGDRQEACQRLAGLLGIGEIYAEQTPEQKQAVIVRLSAEAPTALVGDGINDAPALAKATVGISMSEASQLAMQTADVVLMGNGLGRLPAALELGRHTFTTIRQNLFWAFFYNIVAIPFAALGWLSPAVAALVMGFSDVVLAFNSLKLFIKKVE